MEPRFDRTRSVHGAGIGVSWKAAGRRLEVPAELVLAAVFKTVGWCVNHITGGFDSHALPLLSVARFRNDWQYPAKSPTFRFTPNVPFEMVFGLLQWIFPRRWSHPSHPVAAKKLNARWSGL